MLQYSFNCGTGTTGSTSTVGKKNVELQKACSSTLCDTCTNTRFYGIEVETQNKKVFFQHHNYSILKNDEDYHSRPHSVLFPFFLKKKKKLQIKVQSSRSDKC